MSTDENAIHFGAIRQAFANNNAAVMVGAGFSRNAEGGDSLATWPEVGKALWKELNPDTDEAAFSTAMVTQLGEQYSRVFSVPALENLLKQLIPDDKVAPGQLHEQLLKLPWSEIFTTNYDTLLERAAEKILDRAHFTVCCREDIPLSKILDRRRIVKLHGSFPSQRPFIFTEEHYRKYPQEFAPFVNLVRQSLLENIFCLIGFSGDDPNFLHWIGWVRDMLDDHALPIYLFVHLQPTLGQRRLLEARRVVPVVVPLPPECAVDDYRTRYLELFKILRTPLDTSEDGWGNFSVANSSVSISEEPAAQLAKLVASLPTLVAQRAIYPGWLVAPAKNRRNFDRSLNSLFLRLESPRRYGLHEHPHALVALFAYYTWQQSVLLDPIIDDFAEAAITAIEATAVHNLDTATAMNEVLLSMGIRDQKSFRTAWIEACVGVLRWARQELKLEVFSRIRSLLESKSKAKVLVDEIEYEAVLLDFYLGDMEAARKRLAAWHPGTVDAYMLVRKGSLLSELGEVDAGLTLCMDGIQHLRAAQKIGRKSLLPLSQEAWACHVAHNIQRAKKYSHWFAPQDESNENESIAHLSVRLSSLAAKGFDVRREQEEILSQLNAEAQRPSVPRYRFNGFDLGATSTTHRFGHPSELQSKIEAAEAWLNLADRVGLVPRIGNVRFTVDAYTQAAWWIQYNNTIRRMLSVAIRTGEDDIFKPKDEAVPQHKTGWLSRYQVARTAGDTAIDICGRALTQAECGLASSRSQAEVERACKFNTEIFSRLVIRIESSEVVLAFARRLITLHCTDKLQRNPRLWGAFALALERCVEAIEPSVRQQLIADVIKIPFLPSHAVADHLLDDWARPLRFLGQVFTNISPALQLALDSEIATLIAEIAAPIQAAPDANAERRVFVWDRLFALEALGLIPKATATAIGQILWNAASLWPILPKFQHTAAFVWPAPTGINAKKKFQTFILKTRVANISSASAMTVQGRNTRRSWGFPASNEFFTNWIAAHERQPWPVKDLILGLKEIKSWWDSEWSDIEHDVEFIKDHLHEAVVQRLHLIDEIFDLSADHVFSTKRVLPDDLAQWLAQVVVKAQAFGCPMWRSRMRLGRQRHDVQAVVALQSDLSAELVSPNSESKWTIYKVINDWIKNPALDGSTLTLLLDTVFAVIATRRMPALGICIYLAEELIKENVKWVTDSRVQVLGIGMTALLSELDYTKRVPGTDISDEHIPLLRYYCARLAVTAAATFGGEAPAWVNAWIDAARVDPLPELRFMNNVYAGYQTNFL